MGGTPMLLMGKMPMPRGRPGGNRAKRTQFARSKMDRQVLFGKAVMSDSAQIGPRKTNPICDPAKPAWAAEAVRSVPVRAYCGLGVPSASLSGQALSMSGNHGRDAHATRPPAGGTASPAGGNCAKRTQLARESQVCSVECQASGPEGAKRTQFRRPAGVPGDKMCETNPIWARWSAGGWFYKTKSIWRAGHNSLDPRQAGVKVLGLTYGLVGRLL
jgi:hypothetical protein